MYLLVSVVRTRAVQSVGTRNRGGRDLVLLVVTFPRHSGAYRLLGLFKGPDAHPIRRVSQGDLKVAFSTHLPNAVTMAETGSTKVTQAVWTLYL